MPRLLFAALLLLATLPAQAGDYRQHPELLALADELAREDGIEAAAVLALLGNAQRKQAILDAIARPAERTLTWGEYRPRFLDERRITQGVAFRQRHAAVLARAEQQHGVPAEIIAAIIGVETFYGRNKGSWRVIDALSTLAFDYPPRAPFFRQQLKEFVRLEQSAHIRLADATGSYAGAMGFPQFMPSSYRAYAVDFDGDGVIDLLNNPVDAIGSVANYLRVHGWQRGAPVAARMTATGDGHGAVVNQGLEPKFTVRELGQAGLRIASCVNAGGVPVDYCADPGPDEKVTAWQLAGADGEEFWLGLPNFYAITRYNRSAMYALAVLQLATATSQRLHIDDVRAGR